ncbi:MAG: S8 family peptidase [Oceanipulchritudo sp.]
MALLLVWLMLAWPAGPEEAQTRTHSDARDPSADFPADPAVFEIPAERPKTQSLPGIPLPVPGEEAIAGEYTVFFEDASSMRAFIRRAGAAGLRILGVVDEFHAVRVGATAGQLRPLLGKGMTVDNNHRIEAPELPDSESWPYARYRSFESEAMAFLGAGPLEDRLDWGEGITIAVLDSGWTGHATIPEGRVRMIDLLGSPLAGQYAGHGTAVAGLVFSDDPFAPGIAPGSDILSIRVLDGEGRGDAFTLAEGILEAVRNGADVINMSLGGYTDSRIVRAAVDYADSMGVVLVASSGNDGKGLVSYPAAYESVIGVAAVDADGNRAPFSNFGEGIDVAAPGYRVNALWSDDAFIYFDGTSAAAPLVAGMAARILQSGQAANPREVRDLIREKANEAGVPGDDLYFGAGILNAQRIEETGLPGIYDLAVGDFYPALEEANGSHFPLYVIVENRGTGFIPEATVMVSLDGSNRIYRFSGLVPGKVEAIEIPVSIGDLAAGRNFDVQAVVVPADGFEDVRPGNNLGGVNLVKTPETGPPPGD